MKIIGHKRNNKIRFDLISGSNGTSHYLDTDMKFGEAREVANRKAKAKGLPAFIHDRKGATEKFYVTW